MSLTIDMLKTEIKKINQPIVVNLGESLTKINKIAEGKQP